MDTELRLIPYISHPRIDEVHHIYKTFKKKGELEARMERKQIDEICIVNRVISPVPPVVHNPDNTVSELVGINNSYTTVLSWKYHVEFHVGQNQT
mgnify:CR=1 FL=1